MKVALVHDYLNQAGGAERVVGALHRMFPAAPIFTTIVDRSTLGHGLRNADIRPTWMQRLPGMPRRFKSYLPLYPMAIEGIDLRGYDLVLSSSSAFAKSAITPPETVHVCYCHSPMRFGWDFEQYMERTHHGGLTRAALKPVIRRLRSWDRRTAHRPDVYVANSRHTAERIRRFYDRPSAVVFPPVDVDRYRPSADGDGHYLVVSRLNAYKRVDLVIEAFRRLEPRQVVIVGDGPARAALERSAGPNVRFVGRLPDPEVAIAYARCRAFILPGEEDFGIAPLEANAAGRPVIAFAGGGALDTVVPEVTGVLFAQQTAEQLQAAIRRSETIAWDPRVLRCHAEKFAPQEFARRMTAVIEQALASRHGTLGPEVRR